MDIFSATPVACFSLCPSRVEGGLVCRTAASPRVQSLPRWTTCMGLRPGRAGSNNGTKSRRSVSLISLSCPSVVSLSLTPCPLKYYGLLHPVDIKEDILECNSVELSFALTRFIQEVRRPNGDAYSPDSIFYLCLGIQQVPTHSFTHTIFGLIPLQLCLLFVWAVPVYARPDREHLHWSALQPVHCWDHRDAADLEAEIITQRYEPYRNYIFASKDSVTPPCSCCIHAFYRFKSISNSCK